MTGSNHNISIKERFSSLYELVLKENETNGNKVIVAHLGEISLDKVNDIGFDIENKLKEGGEKKGTIKRIFSIVIEALQNIRLHGEKDKEGIQWTYFVLVQKNGTYEIACANVISNNNISRVDEKIKHINSLDKEGLKEYYMQVLTDGEISQKGGAGLGFITIAMKAKNKINHEFIPSENEQHVFKMSVTVAFEE
jgi:anti-sigma regulatory factor (Ser/Thr protein kinase)